MSNILHLDFETHSEVDLRKVGSYAYAMHPSTRVLCMAWRFDSSGPVMSWSPHLRKLGIAETPTAIEDFPHWVLEYVRNNHPVAGWNVSFEFLIWNYVLKREVHGLPVLMLTQLHDVMAQAAYHGVPLSLDQAAAALPLGVRKDRAGHQLMLRMSRPRTKASGNAPATWWHETDAGKLSELMAYCRQDVLTESAIEDYLPELPPREQDIWRVDFRANLRGIKLDADLAVQMVRVARAETERLNANVNQATQGLVSTTTQAGVLVNWLNQRGGFGSTLTPVASVAKDKLPALIARAGAMGDHMALSALRSRAEAAKSSVAKVHTMLRWAQADGRMHWLTAYYGAFRTGRWAGRGPQVQNYPRPNRSREDIRHIIGYLMALNKYSPDDLPDMLDGLEMFWGLTPLDALKNTLRGCLVPSRDRLFASVDFSQIEARVLAWLAGEDWVLDAYRSGVDLYVQQAARVFGVCEKDVSPYQRQVGKVTILALGYQGGPRAFEKMAEAYDLDLAGLNLDDIVLAYRASVPRIRSYWYDVEHAAKIALAKSGRVIGVTTVHSNKFRPGSIPEVQFATWRGHLLCKLPSGRKLYYRDAQLAPGGRYGGTVISYMGVDQYTRAWTRIETYGGMLVENITQATARDLLADAMLRVESIPGTALLGSVHDEVLAEVDDENSYARMLAAMKEVPAWAKGLPIDADGYIGERFGK